VAEEEDGVEAGQLVAGRYRLIAEVGKGGMGSVWRAIDEASPTSNATRPNAKPVEVALKVILPKRLEGSPEKRELAVGRFSREARALMKLKSPHVVALHDHGSAGDHIYIAMELLRGESLAARLKRVKKLDVAETVRLFNHITAAIDLAHRSQIVHRDLKPGNIFMARQGAGNEDVAKVLDFGLVKSVGTPLATLDVHTRTGSLLGTPYYMSPEQARALPDVDHRTDLWSLGVIAFECLCGIKPFRGKVLAKVFAQIASGEAPVPSESAVVPRGFDAWFARSVQLDPAQRFPSASAMMEELREVLVDAAISTRNARKKRLEADVTGVSLGREGMSHTAPVGSAREPLPLVGRDTELAHVDTLLAQGGRVITLTGPAGVGKTRLAREAARRWRDEHALPSVACWLDEAGDEPLCWLEFSSGLDMDGSGEPAPNDIARALRALGRAVVLIDALDGARDGIARALPAWLAAAPEVVFLMTARRALGIPGEVALDIRPLAPVVPAPSGLRELMQHPAAALFLVRAIRRDPGVLSQEERTKNLATFVDRFGGLPLGLHLAAGLVAEQHFDQLAASLDAEFARLPAVPAPDARATLTTTVRWIFNQLSFAERSTLAQLSVFRDGFTLDASEAVVDGAWRVVQRPYEIVLELAARGLLQHEEPLVGESRYRMAPALASHASASLAEGADDFDPEARGASARHAAYFSTLGEHAVLAALRNRGGLVRRTRLALEAPNLQAALTWTLEAHEHALAAPLALALATLLRFERLPAAAATTLETVANVPGLGAPMRLALELERGRCHRAAGRADLAWAAFERARALAAELADALAESLAYSELGITALAAGNAHDAHRACVAAMQLAGDRGHAFALSMRLLGGLSLELGRGTDAEAAFEHATIHHRANGHRLLEAEALMFWGETLAERSQEERATPLFEDSHVLFGELGNRLDQTRALTWIGELQARRDPATAHRTLERAAARARELGCAPAEGMHLALWALSLLERGDSQRAVRGVRRAEELLQGTSDLEKLMVVYLCRAWLELCGNDHAAALIEWAHIEHCAAGARIRPASRLGRAAARLRTALGG
jgi:serine/threonine protein kinase/predicted ATPase